MPILYKLHQYGTQFLNFIGLVSTSFLYGLEGLRQVLDREVFLSNVLYTLGHLSDTFGSCGSLVAHIIDLNKSKKNNRPNVLVECVGESY